TAPGICTVQVDGVASAERESAVRRALDQLATLGLHGTAGLGATPLLALYAARQARPVLVVSEVRAFLAPLALATADPPPAIAEILAGWGIRTLGEFTALPKASLAQRLGPAGLALWERAAGECERPLCLTTPPRAFV